MDIAEQIFPHLNASLNAIATLLLVAGFVLIRRRRELAHRWAMLAAFGVSLLFLGSYLFFHLVIKGGESTRFPDYPPAWVRTVYLTILFSHMLLAAGVPFLAVASIYFGLRDQRQRHRRLVRLTLPIWLYVSVTGVVVYVMLYQLFPPR